MNRILVILHIFYHDQVDFFVSRLNNIRGYNWDLVVTLDQMNESTTEKIRRMKPDAQFIIVDNIGYDVWPFIQAARTVNISKYDLVLKLHTKNIDKFIWKINGLKLTGEKWRNLLVDSILGSPVQFDKCLEAFKDQQTGMVCSYELLVKPSNKFPEDKELLIAEGERIGLRDVRQPFCAGTVFIVRPVCLTKIINATFENSRWQSSNQSHQMATLAHVYERIFGSAVSDSGMTVKGVPSSMYNYFKIRIHKTFGCILKNILNADYAEDGNKYLTVLGIRFLLKKNQ